MERVLAFSLFVVVLTLLACSMVATRRLLPFGLALSLVLALFGPAQSAYLLHLFTNVSCVLLALYWAFILLVSIPLISHIAKQPKAVKSVTVLRKAFHLVAVLLFGPPLVRRSNFDFIAVAGVSAFCFMVLLEFLRVNLSFPKLSFALNGVLAPLLDEKDRTAALVTSHIQLLLACVAPVWLNQSFFPKSDFANSNRFLLSGLLTVGIGDSAAAIAGIYVGKPTRLFFNPNKSLEGFVSFIVSVTFALWLVSALNLSTIIATLLSAVTEACVKRYDNIALPIVFATLAYLIGIYPCCLFELNNAERE